MSKNEQAKECRRCLMDTSDPEIRFTESGCHHCEHYLLQMKRLNAIKENKTHLTNQIDAIKKSSRGKKFDCVMGVSGGVDSTYVLYQAKKLGLRPLAVHFDNGWNSELAVDNIERILKRLDVPLQTHVARWSEFKDLQLAFLKASVPDVEIPTDHMICAVLYQKAAELGIKTIVSGTNFVSEGILPQSWTYGILDWTYIDDIHRRFGKISIEHLPKIALWQRSRLQIGKRIGSVQLLNFLPYDKEAAKQFLIQELGWRDYGGKHYESVYTRFIQAYLLPKKFGIDKRRAHLSCQVLSGAMARTDAVQALEAPALEDERLREDKTFVLKKLDLDDRAFTEILNAPVKNYRDYRNQSGFYRAVASLVTQARRVGLLTPTAGI